MDFDKLREENEDLEFKISGQTFRIQRLPMSIVDVWETREEPVNVSEVNEFTTMLIDRVADAVKDGNGSEKRWRELCGSPEAPSYGELVDIANMVWRSQTALPTQRLSNASAGPVVIGPTSKAE